MGARLRLEYSTLDNLLPHIKACQITLGHADLERLLERERLRYPGFTCLHAALVFRQFKDVRVCLGVSPVNVADGHAWVEDNKGHTWLRGPRIWQQIWKEE